MPHDFADLIAELDAAKANLARRVKRTRPLISEHRAPDAGHAEGVKSAFRWGEDKVR